MSSNFYVSSTSTYFKVSSINSSNVISSYFYLLIFKKRKLKIFQSIFTKLNIHKLLVYNIFKILIRFSIIIHS